MFPLRLHHTEGIVIRLSEGKRRPCSGYCVMRRVQSFSPPSEVRIALAIQTTQKVGNPRRNRLFHNVAVHLPNIIAHANSDGMGDTTVGIIKIDCPFRRRIGFPLIGRRPPWRASECPFQVVLLICSGHPA